MFKRISFIYKLIQSLHGDHKVPSKSKILFWSALVYLFMPIDLLPDIIPLVGQIDDLTITPVLLLIAWKLIGKKLRTHHMNIVDTTLSSSSSDNNKK